MTQTDHFMPKKPKKAVHVQINQSHEKALNPSQITEFVIEELAWQHRRLEQHWEFQSTLERDLKKKKESKES